MSYRIGTLTRTRTDGSKHWSYCLKYGTEANRVRVTLDTQDEVEAHAMARRIWAKIQGQRTLETVGDYVDAYLGDRDRLDPVPDADRKRCAWLAAAPYWADLRPSLVDAGVVAGYTPWRSRSINTVRQELSVVRTSLNWAVREKLLAEAPKITLPPMPETSVGHLTKEQFRLLLAGCSAPHVSLFAMLAVTTGGRKSAILQAKWVQVDFDRCLINLNASDRVQNRKHRATVPLNDMIMPALRKAEAGSLSEYIIEHRGKPLLDIKKGIAAAARRSGVRVHPHMFRHSAAVWMAEDRVPMTEIGAFLGHRDINVTARIYARYHPDFLRDAARSLTW